MSTPQDHSLGLKSGRHQSPRPSWRPGAVGRSRVRIGARDRIKGERDPPHQTDRQSTQAVARPGYICDIEAALAFARARYVPKPTEVSVPMPMSAFSP